MEAVIQQATRQNTIILIKEVAQKANAQSATYGGKVALHQGHRLELLLSLLDHLQNEYLYHH